MRVLVYLLAIGLILINVSYITAQGEEEIIEEEETLVPTEGPEGATDEAPEEGDDEKKEPEPEDPCVGVECGYGKQCAANPEGRGICVCSQSCHHKAGYGPRFQVCSNQNETFPNICDMEREKCMCESAETGCQDAKHKTVELKYYGHCRGPLVCPEETLTEFPVRIRLWLRHVLTSMVQRHDLSRSEVMMAREAQQEERAEITPVLWKFCDLDKDPSDGQVSQRELLPLIAQLYPLEDCSDSFFTSCDTDKNKDISLDEFGSCFGLAKENIKNRCSEVGIDEDSTPPQGPEPGFLTDES